MNWLKNFLSKLWKLLKFVIAVILICLAIYCIFITGGAAVTFLGPLFAGVSGVTAGIFLAGASFLLFPDESAEVVGRIGEAVGEVAEAVVEAATGVVGSVFGAASPLLLAAGAVFLFLFLGRKDKKRAEGKAKKDAGKTNEPASTDAAGSASSKTAAGSPQATDPLLLPREVPL